MIPRQCAPTASPSFSALLRQSRKSARCSSLRTDIALQARQVQTHSRNKVLRIDRRRTASLTSLVFRPPHSAGSRLDCRPLRSFTSTPSTQHGDLTPPRAGEERHVTFIDKEGSSHTFQVADGDNLLDIAQANDLEMEGACGGSCACSTCHVIVREEEMYDKMEEPSDDENDMLDLAFGLTETSRLGCQVKMSKDLDGVVVKLPSMTRNMQASDFVDKK